jgi:Uma2 family endonuclease
VQALTQPISFEDFIAGQRNNGCYELRNGAIVEMQPRGKHEEVVGFLVSELVYQARQLDLPYFVPKQALVKSPTEPNSAYLPDLLLVDRRPLALEPLWARASTLTLGTSIPLIVEVVSTNWRDDYLKKLADYEELGVVEYWLVDYLGLGGVRFIGSPKQPTLSIAQLVDGEYQIRQFRGADDLRSVGDHRLVSRTFPGLELTAARALMLDEGA